MIRPALKIPADQLLAEANPPALGSRYGSVLALADQVVVSAVNFLTGVMIGRACSKDELGLYMLGFSIVFFITTLQNSLIWTPYMIFSPRLRGKEHAEYSGSSLAHQVILSLATIFTLALGASALALGIGPVELAPVLWTLSAVIAFLLMREAARQICFARLRMEMAFLLDCSAAVVQIGGLGMLAYYQRLSASTAWWMAGGASSIAMFLWLAWMRNDMLVRPASVISDLQRNWSFGKWVFVSGITWALTAYLYPWILAGLHGPAATGTWAACLGIVGITNPLVVGIQNFLGPSIAHSSAGGGAPALQRHVFKAAIAMTAILLVLFIPLMIFGGWLVILVYGDNYAGNGLAVCWLTLGTLVGATAFAFSRGLFAIHRAKTDFWANAVGLVVLLVFGLWLAGSYGATGAAFGLLLGNILGLAVRCVGFRSAMTNQLNKTGGHTQNESLGVEEIGWHAQNEVMGVESGEPRPSLRSGTCHPALNSGTCLPLPGLSE
jgi:O-antigen/teichoic acid export membrane protein